MQDRIISLKRQLMCKHEIIDKLLNRIFTLEGSRENALERPSYESVSMATNNDGMVILLNKTARWCRVQMYLKISMT